MVRSRPLPRASAASWRAIGRALTFAALLLPVAPSVAAGPALMPAVLGWSPVDATWTLRVRPDAPVQVEATYRFASADGQPAELKLVGVGLLLLEAPGGAILQASGLSIALPAGERASSATLTGLYTPPRPGSFQLNILPATTTRVIVDAPGFDVTLPDAVDGLLPPTASTLRAEWAPHQDTPPRRQSAIVRGESASTFQAESGALVVDTRVRWQVLRGESGRFSVDVKGLEDLTITGPNVASWEQSGGTVTVRTQSPVRQSLDIRVTGRAPLRKGEVTIPIPTPAGVTQTERWITMARSDEGALIPMSAPPAVALTRVPAWARGLGTGAPLAAWQGNKPVTVLVANAEPIDGPPVLVTVSRYVVAAAQDGRLAVRQALRVRNERRQYLKVTPPGPGWTLLVARVGNQPRTVSSDGKGGYLVPLDRSEETVRGPLSFPVDLEWIAEGAAWGSKGEQALRLPAVDAPVQAASWEVHLPRGFAREGEPEESTGGFVVTDLRVEDLEQQRKAQELAGSAVQKALDAWRSNDFDATAQWLDQVRSADPTNEEAAALQSNLDALNNRSNDLAARRVRDVARSRAVDSYAAQSAALAEAKAKEDAGDLAGAAAAYEEVRKSAQALRQLEQPEAVEQVEQMAEAAKRARDLRGIAEGEKAAYQSLSKADAEAKPAPAGSSALGASSTPTSASSTTRSAEKQGYREVEEDEEAEFGAEADDDAAPERESKKEAPPAPKAAPKAMAAPASAPVLRAKPSSSGPSKDRAELAPAAPSGQGSAAAAATRDRRPSSPEPTPEVVAPIPAPAVAAPTSGTEAGALEFRAQAPPASVPAQPAPAVDTAPPEPSDKLQAITSAAASVRPAAKAELQEERRNEEREERHARFSQRFDQLVAQTEALRVRAADLRTRGCPEAAEAEEFAEIALEQADIVISERDLAFVGDVQPFVEDARRVVDEALLGCTNVPIAEAPPRVIERREPLVATPSPLALALPLDGPAVSATQALLPAGEFPTWRLRYRREPGTPP